MITTLANSPAAQMTALVLLAAVIAAVLPFAAVIAGFGLLCLCLPSSKALERQLAQAELEDAMARAGQATQDRDDQEAS